MRSSIAAGAMAAACLVLASGAAPAQTPKKGGTLNFGVVAEPPTHGLPRHHHVRHGAPGGAAVLDAAEVHGPARQSSRSRATSPKSWEVSKDGLTYTFKLRRGVKFHDGSDFTSEDIKATYERIVNPMAGVISVAQGPAPGHQADRDARPLHGRVQARPGEHVDAAALRLALQLRLQRQEAEGEPQVSRDRGDGDGRLQVRRVRQGLALARGALRPVLPQGPPLPRRLQGLSSCAATRW